MYVPRAIIFRSLEFKEIPRMIRFDRLRDCITCLEESPNPHRFTMSLCFHYEYPCATPACVVGHYWARYLSDERIQSAIPNDWFSVPEHFGLSEGHVQELFGPKDVAMRRPSGEAIAYLEGFIARHELKENFAKNLVEQLPLFEALEVA